MKKILSLLVSVLLVSTCAFAQYPIAGQSANNASYTGNPVGIGGYAGSATLPSSVTAGNMVRFLTDLIGRPVHVLYAPPENSIMCNVSPFSSGSAQILCAAQAAGVRTYITQLHIGNNGGSNGQFWLQDGASTVLTFNLQAGTAQNIVFPYPVRGSAATAWNVQTNTAITSTYCNASGFTLPY